MLGVAISGVGQNQPKKIGYNLVLLIMRGCFGGELARGGWGSRQAGQPAFFFFSSCGPPPFIPFQPPIGRQLHSDIFLFREGAIVFVNRVGMVERKLT